MAAIHVTAEHFKDVVLKADKPVLVDFWDRVRIWDRS